MRCLAFLLIALVVGCSDEAQPPLVANDVVITRPMPGMKMSAAYLSLTNNSAATIRISAVASAQFESVQLHQTVIEDGIARMRPMAVLEIPAGETVTLARGGEHLMLMRPTGPSDTVSLQFFDGDNLMLTVAATYEQGTE